MTKSQTDGDELQRGRVVVALACVLIASALFRGFHAGELAVDQYDEGAYAMSAQAVADGTFPAGAYPTQHYLSPPLLFGSVGLLARSGLDVEATLITLVIVLGVLTSLAAFVVVRGLVGAGAGLAAATLIAFSDYHVLYSRIGLTDVPFAFFFLLAVGACSLARQRYAWGYWVLAGLAVGLAWNTKYHGWLAGVIAASALIIDLASPPPGRTRAGIAIRFALSVVIACALYLPWAMYIFDQPGGYVKVLNEHASFLHREDWVPNAVGQMRAQIYCDGWLSRAAPGVVLVLVAWVGGRLRLATVAAAAGLSALACAITGSAVAVVLALVGVVVLLADRSRRSWQLAAWAACFTILTPLYHPYVRLALPFMLATWCVAGAGFDLLSRTVHRRPAAGWIIGVLAVIAAGAVVIGGARPGLADRSTRAVATWHDKSGTPRVADEIAAALPVGAVVDVVGEPGLVFHLRRRGFDARHRDHLEHIRSLERGRRSWVVVGIYGRKGKALARLRSVKRLVIEKRATAFFRVGEVRRLNNMRVAAALEDRARGGIGHEIDLYSITVR